MSFDHPWALFSGLIIGGIGMVLLMYGKKQVNVGCLLTGGALCVFPYFVSSLIVMWLITGACLGGCTSVLDRPNLSLIRNILASRDHFDRPLLAIDRLSNCNISAADP
ncbi:MAG: hypothetical protein H7Y88_09115 [Phycisphaerales bacterium]|nr:hypothetical protein [Phycisphaerales bacterium]